MKRKVKLVFVKNYLEAPTWADTTAYDCEVTVPENFGDQGIHLTAARVYESTPNELPGGDSNAIILDSQDFSSILGKLLTYVDATYTDPEQRKAHKDLIKQTLWGWEHELRERAIQTVDSHSEDLIK